jgi:hypothetical protein
MGTRPSVTCEHTLCQQLARKQARTERRTQLTKKADMMRIIYWYSLGTMLSSESQVNQLATSEA